MATQSLIKKLNRLAHLTPDQIVTNLAYSGWIKGSDFTPEIFAVFHDRPTRVWFNPGPHRPARNGDAAVHDFRWQLNYPSGRGISGLMTYYFILEENFTGEYPHVD